MVEVAKALSLNARILVMDEPTAPLTNREIDTLFGIIRMLKERGVAIIYISHRLEEVKEVCDRATIMRDGKNITAVDVADVSIDEIIRYMVGRELKEKFPKIHVPLGEELLRVEHLNAGKQVKDISFTVRAGEILGIAGLVGAGPHGDGAGHLRHGQKGFRRDLSGRQARGHPPPRWTPSKPASASPPRTARARDWC